MWCVLHLRLVQHREGTNSSSVFQAIYHCLVALVDVVFAVVVFDAVAAGTAAARAAGAPAIYGSVAATAVGRRLVG